MKFKYDKVSINMDAVIAAVNAISADVNPQFEDSAAAASASKEVEKINNLLGALQVEISRVGEDANKELRQYIERGSFWRSEARAAEMQKLIDSWVGFPKSEADRMIQRALAEVDHDHEANVERLMYAISDCGVNIATDVDLTGEWKLSDGDVANLRKGAVKSLSASQMEDLGLLIAYKAIENEIIGRGYKILLQSGISKEKDTNSLREAVSICHNTFMDKRTPEDVREDIRQRAIKANIPLWKLEQ